MRNLYYRLLTGLFLLSLPQILTAQVISGSVYHTKRGIPMSGVSVRIEGTALSATTSFEGRFYINNIPTGKSEIIFEKTGFISKTAGIEYERGQDTISIGISLCPTSTSIDREKQSVAWRYNRQNNQTPQSVASLDGDMIREVPARNLPDILLGVPGGAWIQNSYASTSPQIRGLSGNHVLLLKNNIPILPSTLSQGASPWWLTVDPMSISRVEILRGSGSVLYGNNASGGVVSLQTNQPEFSDGKGQIHVTAGTRLQPGSAELGGNAGIQLANNGISLSTNVYRRDFGAMPLASSSTADRPGGYDTKGLESTLNIRISPNHLLQVAWERHNLQIDTVGSIQEDWQDQKLTREQFSTKWTGFFEEVWWKEISLTAVRQNYHQDRRYLIDEINPIAIREDEALETVRAMLEIRSNPIFLWNAVSGVDVARHEVESKAWMLPPDGSVDPTLPSIPNGATQEEVGIYSLHTVDILKLRLAFGGRAQAQRVMWDDVRWGADTWTPQALTGNISAMYALTRGIDITSSFRTGFRAPGLADLRSGLPSQGTIVIPSDSLGAERTFSSEIGLKADNKYFSGSLVFYHSQLTDWMRQIASTYQGNPLWQGLAVQQSINIDQAFVQGVEAEVEVPVNKTASFYGSLTYTYGLNVSQSDFLSAIPPINSRLGMRLNPGTGVWSRVEWRHASSQTQLSVQDILSPTQDPDGTPGWNVVHLHVGYDFNWGYMMLGVENVFDSRYMYHGSTIESPGRLLIFSMQVGF